MKPLC